MKVVVIPGLTLREVEEPDLMRMKAAGATEIVITTPQGAHNEVANADVIFGFVPKRLFLACQNLKWVHSISSGVDAFMYPEFQQSQVVLSSEKGLVGSHLADHGMGLLLTLTRQIKTSLTLHVDAWNHRPEMRIKDVELTGLKMGILGFGGTGKAMAKRAVAFGMSVEAIDCDEVSTTAEVSKVHDPDYWDQMLEESDVLAVCCPLTAETQGILDSRAFEKMKTSSFLVNVTRGEVVVEEDLINALKSGEIQGAALDVTPREPLPDDSELWDLPNVVMTPHTAGASQYRASRNMDRFIRNLEIFNASGSTDEFDGIIDKYKGY